MACPSKVVFGDVLLVRCTETELHCYAHQGTVRTETTRMAINPPRAHAVHVVTWDDEGAVRIYGVVNPTCQPPANDTAPASAGVGEVPLDGIRQ